MADAEIDVDLVADPGEPNYPKAIGAVDTTAPDLSRVRVIDIETGEELKSYPGELVLVDNTEGHYSHSFMRSYNECNAKGYYKKIHAPKKPAFALERGSAAHETIEMCEKNPEVTEEQAISYLRNEWGVRMLDHKAEFSESDQWKIDNLFEETALMVTDWIYENHGQVKAGWIKPEDVEIEFNLPALLHTAQGSFRRRFLGKLDLVLWLPDRSGYSIVDYKSSAQPPNEKGERARDQQFTLYQWAATQMFGMPPMAMYFYLLRGQHKKPEDHNPPLIAKSGKYKGQPLKKSPSFGEDHPRVPECLKYAFEMPLRTEQQIQNYFNNYVVGTIVSYESGQVSKTGAWDGEACSRCEYAEFCDTFDVPLPRFARVG